MPLDCTYFKFEMRKLFEVKMFVRWQLYNLLWSAGLENFIKILDFFKDGLLSWHFETTVPYWSLYLSRIWFLCRLNHLYSTMAISYIIKMLMVFSIAEREAIWGEYIFLVEFVFKNQWIYVTKVNILQMVNFKGQGFWN